MKRISKRFTVWRMDYRRARMELGVTGDYGSNSGERWWWQENQDGSRKEVLGFRM